MVLHRKPVHVASVVRPAGAQRNDAVYLVARTCAADLLCGGTRTLSAKGDRSVQVRGMIFPDAGAELPATPAVP